MSFGAAQHLVSSYVTDDGDAVGLQGAAASMAGELGTGLAAPTANGSRSLRTRLAKLLDAVSGTADDD
jgi:hypothetical protein